MKIKIRGKVHRAEQPKEFRNSFRVQEVVLFKPAWTDDFGEKRGKDDYFLLKLFNEKIDEQQATKLIGQKVEATCFLNGRSFDTDQGPAYVNDLVVNDFEIIKTGGAS